MLSCGLLLSSGLNAPSAASKAASAASTDRTNIGTLNVPRLGIGTIAWTDKIDRDAIALASMELGLDLFDTAERYGAKASSLVPASLAAIGLPVKKDYLGGDTECYLGSKLTHATIATKFSPTPWRGDAQSVVDACRASAKRLNRGSVDLIQVHMVRRSFALSHSSPNNSPQ